MADEAPNAELRWRVESLERRAPEFVGRLEYAARQEAAEHRFADLAADVARLDRKHDELDRRHDEDIKALRNELGDHKKDHTASTLSWRQIVWPMLGAFVASAAAIAVTLLTSGGH